MLKNWCFWTVGLEKTLESPWTAKRSNQSILKEINPEYSLKGLMQKLTLWYFGHLMQRAIGKDPDAGKDWEQKGVTEDEMVGWHHWLNGHAFKQTPGDSEGQGSLACYSPWGHKELDTTERLNWTGPSSCTLCACVCFKLPLLFLLSRNRLRVIIVFKKFLTFLNQTEMYEYIYLTLLKQA